MSTVYEGGVIIYQKIFGLPKYLLIHRNNWEWGFPKGPLTKSANPKSLASFRSAAVLATKRQTNLDVQPGTDFVKTLRYQPRQNRASRLVKIMIARVKPHVIVTPPKNQVMDYGWFDFRTAYRTLYYDNQRNVFYDANQVIRKRLMG